ncbi:MAG: hypothetical protein ACXVJB_06915 [Mucilaginibacter sp.]
MHSNSIRPEWVPSGYRDEEQKGEKPGVGTGPGNFPPQAWVCNIRTKHGLSAPHLKQKKHRNTRH